MANRSFKALCFLDAPAVQHSRTVHFTHTVFMGFVFISVQTATLPYLT